ncbi:MAG: dihydrolipoyl dehydrogenase [Bacillota bacterium]
MDFDVLVIGGGPGGYVAAIRAAQLGAKTALVEKEELGGTCLNRGCIPTKALLAASEKVAEIKQAEKFGISVSGLKVDFERMIERKNAVVNRLRGGVNFLLQKNKVKVFKGTAGFLDGRTVQISRGGENEKATAAKIIIATGSVPRRLNIPGNAEGVLDSDDVLNLRELPESLVIIGGGVIGVEFGSIFSNLGTKVTIVEIMDRILPQVDRELAGLLLNQLKKKGITVLTGSKVEEVRKAGSRNVVLVSRGGSAGAEVVADKVLVAPGRVPFVEGLNLEAAGVAWSREGIAVSEDLTTSIDHIYAIGDVTGGVQLAHLASAQGIRAAEHAAGRKSYISMKYVPSCIYTDPEVASAGFTEEELQQKGIAYKAARFPLQASGKALAMGYEEGLVKILYDPEFGEVLGVHMVAPRATDIIAEAVLAMRAELTVAEIATTIHAHPTLSEALLEAAHVAHGTPIHSA